MRASVDFNSDDSILESASLITSYAPHYAEPAEASAGGESNYGPRRKPLPRTTVDIYRNLIGTDHFRHLPYSG
jgi:hypothetical protein